MFRTLKVTLVAGLIAATLTGVTYAATRTVPEDAKVAIQNTTAAELPGDKGALEAALKAVGPVKYKILVIDSTDGEDKTAYLDRVAEQWGQPAADTLLLVLFTEDNYDIRFFMGASFRAKNVSVDEMLGLVRGQYFAKVRKGDPAGGLADLIAAVNQRMGADRPNGARAATGEQLKMAKELLTNHLSRFKSDTVQQQSRILDFRFDDADLKVWSESGDRVLYLVKFDVLPASQNTDWYAGNGVQGEHGWVVSKTMFMNVIKSESGWKLDSFSTSP